MKGSFASTSLILPKRLASTKAISVPHISGIMLPLKVGLVSGSAILRINLTNRGGHVFSSFVG